MNKFDMTDGTAVASGAGSPTVFPHQLFPSCVGLEPGFQDTSMLCFVTTFGCTLGP